MPLKERKPLEPRMTQNQLVTVLKEGHGSLVNADKLDGKEASDFELKDCGIGMIPEGKQCTKIGFWEDSNGDIKYVKFYDGDELLFTLTFSNAGEAASETWNISRT